MTQASIGPQRGARLARRSVGAMMVGLLAALAYSSWPVAYLVNPALAASALASELAASGQPYRWLFVALDCLTGAAALVVAQLAWPSRNSPERRLLIVALMGYAMFGVATAADALVPIRCGSVPIRSCGLDVRHLSADDLLTAVAVFALFVGVCSTYLRAARLAAWNFLSVASLVVAVIWSTSGPVFLAVSLASQPAISMQHVMLSLTSVVAFLVPAITVLVPARSVGDRPATPS